MAKRFNHRWHSECRLFRWLGVLRWSWFRVSFHLHDHQNDLPLAPEKLQIKTECYRTMPSLLHFQPRELPSRSKLFSIKTSICHFRNLKFYVEKGLTVKRLHCVLQFDQSCWLGKYISENIALRKQAKTDFDNKTSLSYFQTPALVRQWKICEIVDKPSFCPLNMRQNPAH